MDMDQTGQQLPDSDSFATVFGRRRGRSDSAPVEDEASVGCVRDLLSGTRDEGLVAARLLAERAQSGPLPEGERSIAWALAISSGDREVKGVLLDVLLAQAPSLDANGRIREVPLLVTALLANDASPAVAIRSEGIVAALRDVVQRDPSLALNVVYGVTDALQSAPSSPHLAALLGELAPQARKESRAWPRDSAFSRLLTGPEADLEASGPIVDGWVEGWLPQADASDGDVLVALAGEHEGFDDEGVMARLVHAWAEGVGRGDPVLIAAGWVAMGADKGADASYEPLRRALLSQLEGPSWETGALVLAPLLGACQTGGSLPTVIRGALDRVCARLADTEEADVACSKALFEAFPLLPEAERARPEVQDAWERLLGAELCLFDGDASSADALFAGDGGVREGLLSLRPRLESAFRGAWCCGSSPYAGAKTSLREDVSRVYGHAASDDAKAFLSTVLSEEQRRRWRAADHGLITPRIHRALDKAGWTEVFGTVLGEVDERAICLARPHEIHVSEAFMERALAGQG
jgi:hypothetical protein